jgi:hypothetical protein
MFFSSFISHSTVPILPGTIYIRHNLSKPCPSSALCRAVLCRAAPRRARLIAMRPELNGCSFLETSLQMPAHHGASQFCSLHDIKCS